MEQPDPPDALAQPRTQDASAAHPVVHPGKRPVRALIAARLSKLQRGGQQGIGIETQDEKFRAFCDREGMTVVAVVADTRSGTVAPWDRKNLKPWVTEPEKMAMYDAVVAYKTDRWSRGTQGFHPDRVLGDAARQAADHRGRPAVPGAGGQVRCGLLAVAGGEDGRAPGMGTGPRARRAGHRHRNHHGPGPVTAAGLAQLSFPSPPHPGRPAPGQPGPGPPTIPATRTHHAVP